MTETALKFETELAEALPPPVRPLSNVVVLPTKRAKPRMIFMPDFKKMGAALLPSLFVMLLALLLWQIFASSPTSGLPPPTTVIAESSDLILHPFFDHGGTDKGLGLHVFASLKRVALGYALAAIVGIALALWWAHRNCSCADLTRCFKFCALCHHWRGFPFHWLRLKTVNLRPSL